MKKMTIQERINKLEAMAHLLALAVCPEIGVEKTFRRIKKLGIGIKTGHKKKS